MRSTFFGLAAVVMGLALISAPAQAAMVSYDYDLNLSESGGVVTGSTSLVPAVEIASGDQVMLNGTFTPGTALSINGNGSEFLSIGLTTSASTFADISNVSVTFFTVGVPNVTMNVSDFISFSPTLGVVMNNFLGDGEFLTFTGYKVSFDVDSLAPTPQMFGTASLTSTSSTVVPVAVPEPEAYASFAIGAMVLGLGAFYSMRRKQELAVA